MKLSKVAVSKYRSIDRKAEFSVGDFTVLIGRNNQGKSNLLRAAVLAMEVIDGWSRFAQRPPEGVELPLRLLLPGRGSPSLRYRRGADRVGYDWEADFPLYARQKSASTHRTSIRLDFELTDEERVQFKSATGVSINERLPIRVDLGPRLASLAIPKQRGTAHKEKAALISRFVTERLALLYVPAVRTGATATRVAEQILASTRRQILGEPQYRTVLEALDEVDRRAAAEVEEVIKASLQNFIPGVNSVGIDARTLSRDAMLDDIRIDDGVSTSLSSKGDGIQSLVALAMTLEWTHAPAHPDRSLVIAVEEPESHLHPGAAHEVRRVLESISQTQQVIVTTHNQALINRENVAGNIVVKDRTAAPATNLHELRAALGIELSDSLAGAEIIVIVEGYHDEEVLKSLICAMSAKVADGIRLGRVVLEGAGSGSKIYSRAVMGRHLLMRPIVVLDGDAAGHADVERLLNDKIVESSQVLQLARRRAKYTELEDIIRIDVYIEALERLLGIGLSKRHKGVLERGVAGAWSERLATMLVELGFPAVANTVKRAKHAVREATVEAISRGDDVLRDECVPQVERLVGLIEAGLNGSGG